MGSLPNTPQPAGRLRPETAVADEELLFVPRDLRGIWLYAADPTIAGLDQDTPLTTSDALWEAHITN